MNTNQFYIRNANNNDFQAIHRLLSLKSSKFFGPTKRKIFDPESFFEIYCTHSILAKEKEEHPNIIGYAEFKHYPKLDAVPKDAWMNWLSFHYCIKLPISYSNTLFLNFFIYDLSYCPDLFTTILCEVFFREPNVRYIIIVVPPFKAHRFKEDEPDFHIVEKYATLFYPKDFSIQNSSNTQKVFIIYRDDIIPVMRFRRALPEDNDEIVEIINQDRPHIKENLGDFYIAEELLSQTQHKTLIVAEVINETVGFIWLNSNLNIIRLIKNFELESFGNLLKFNPEKRAKVLTRNVTELERRPKNRLFNWTTIEALYTEAGKSHGPFLLRGEISSMSIFSYYTLPIEKSDSSSSVVEDESKFIRREIIFKKFGLLENRLGRTEWYIDIKERIFRLRYNTTITGSLDIAASLNAFAMQLYGLHRSNDFRKLYRFLVASFSAYPDRDYCIFSMPESWQFTMGLKQLLHFFIRVIPRPNCVLSDSLYITHRACFMGDITINSVCREDVEQIEKLILYDAEERERASREGPPTKVYEKASRFYMEDTSKQQISTSKFNEPSTDRMEQMSKPNLTATFSQSTSKMRPSKSKHRRASGISKASKSKHSLRTLEEIEEAEQEVPPQEQEAKVLREILDEVFTNPFSDYRFLTIRVGNSTLPPEFNTIIGFAIVRQFHQVHLLRKHYAIPECDEIRDACRGELIMLKLHPLFRFKSDMIFRELARHSDYWDFYYFCPTKNRNLALSNDLVTKMQPIEPRRNKRKFFKDSDMIGFKARKSIAALEELNFSEEYFAIYQHNLRPTKYFSVTEPVVIIGYNDYTKAYLRLNIFRFNHKNTVNTNMYCCVPRLNITVISQPGVVEADRDCEFFCDYCINQDLCYVNWLNTDEFIRDIDYRIDLTKWVKFVNGNVKSINREKQQVVLDNGCEIFYDRLLILSSIFFGPPRQIQLCDTDLPPNYQHINNRYHKILVYHKIQALLEDLPEAESKIIVYGCRVRSFEFINFLLKHGIQGECITLLMPPDIQKDYEIHLNNPFIDRNIEIILQEMIEDLHVNVYENVTFTHWTLYRNDGNIENVSFNVRDTTEHKDVHMTLDCDMFISFNESKTYVSMTDALKVSNLEMVGKNLLVDEYCRTSDRRILAYGRNTMNRTTCNHQRRYTNPREVGEKLMAVLDAPFDSDEIPMDQKFYIPSACKAQLPFDYYMIKICSPKLFLANHLANDYSFVMTTYKDGEFCRVRVNQHYIVEEIVCVTQREMNLDFLSFFCGKHEKLLNNLHIRWSTSRFDNFLDFFQEPWTELLMHDHFDELRQINRELIIETMDDVLRYKKDYDRAARRSIAYRRLADMSIPSEMEEQLFTFLRKYRREFFYSFALPEDFSQ